jgi:hypothetical protein
MGYKERSLEDYINYCKWVEGIDRVKIDNPEKDSKLIDKTEDILIQIAENSVKNLPIPELSSLAAAATALRLGYYLGINGLDADAPELTQEYIKEYVEPLITPDCNCLSCQAKLQILHEYGMEYEMTEERQQLATEIEKYKQINDELKDVFPTEGFNPSVN